MRVHAFPALRVFFKESFEPIAGAGEPENTSLTRRLKESMVQLRPTVAADVSVTMLNCHESDNTILPPYGRVMSVVQSSGYRQSTLAAELSSYHSYRETDSAVYGVSLCLREESQIGFPYRDDSVCDYVSDCSDHEPSSESRSSLLGNLPQRSQNSKGDGHIDAGSLQIHQAKRGDEGLGCRSSPSASLHPPLDGFCPNPSHSLHVWRN